LRAERVMIGAISTFDASSPVTEESAGDRLRSRRLRSQRRVGSYSISRRPAGGRSARRRRFGRAGTSSGSCRPAADSSWLVCPSGQIAPARDTEHAPCELREESRRRRLWCEALQATPLAMGLRRRGDTRRACGYHRLEGLRAPVRRALAHAYLASLLVGRAGAPAPRLPSDDGPDRRQHESARLHVWRETNQRIRSNEHTRRRQY